MRAADQLECLAETLARPRSSVELAHRAGPQLDSPLTSEQVANR